MIIDTSAVVAIAFGEPERTRLIRSLVSADAVSIASPSWLELSIVLSAGLGTHLDSFLDGFERQFALTIVPFSREHAAVAFEAWSRYGKGNHPARLNFGDCISYALAHVAGQPLLFVGDDFARTDIQAA